VPWSGGQRRSEDRVEVHVDVALTRERGNPVSARTIEIGEHGMRVVSARPLSVDEVLRFHLAPPLSENHSDGQARVVREHGSLEYALRVERWDG
jgi:hypothetical protein